MITQCRKTLRRIRGTSLTREADCSLCALLFHCWAESPTYIIYNSYNFSNGISRAFRIAISVVNFISECPLSILLICGTETPIRSASPIWLRLRRFLSALILFPKSCNILFISSLEYHIDRLNKIIYSIIKLIWRL